MKHPISYRGVVIGLLLSGTVAVAQTVAPDAEAAKKAAAGNAVAGSARASETLLVQGTVASPILSEAGTKPVATGGFSAAAIPEPGVYASALGLAVLGVVGLRRWKRRAPSA